MLKNFRISFAVFVMVETIIVIVVVSIGQNMLERWITSLALGESDATLFRIGYIVLALLIVLIVHTRLYQYLKKSGRLY